MKQSSLLRNAIAGWVLAISITSCATVDGRLKAAAEAQGRIAAGVHLADLPPDCREHEAHAALTAGAELHGLLIRERDALDRQNARTDRCADFYDGQKQGLEGK